MYEDFMIGAKCLWENLVGGSTRQMKKEREAKKGTDTAKKPVDPEVKR
jgi:hypothetical protein